MSAVDAKASKKRKAEASSAAFDEAAAAAGEKAKKPKKTPEEKAAKAAKKAAKAAKAAKEAAAAEGAAPAAAAEGAAPAAAPAAAAPEAKRGRSALDKRGIKVLFPIQAATFAAIFDAGKDLLAVTGTGKTLAFALPVVEKLLLDKATQRAPRARARADALAQQVLGDFSDVAHGRLRTLCVYGGSAYGPSCDALRRGVDVVVGTPGRTMDLIEKGVLDASALSFAVLDEADQMLDMGFKDELEKIFAAMAPAGAPARARQLLLFSATLPPWVRNIAKAYAQTDASLEAIDLVGSGGGDARDGLGGIVCQASTDVSHKCVPVASWSMNHKVINDVVGAYGLNGAARCVLFCETKAECNDVVDSKEITYERRALHGDIPQALREKTMAAFRAGQFKILVATDVAARGLDMVVELVVNNKPPATRSGWADAETYVHRSGRTGRAGRKGTAVEDVAPSALPCFEDRAAALAATFAGRHGSSATGGYAEALRAALAKLAGYERGKPADRSLLTNSEHYVTCHYAAGLPIHSISYVWNFLRRELKPEVCDALKAMQLVAEGDGAVFDAPASAKADLVGLDGVSVDIDDRRSSKSAGGKGGKGKGGAAARAAAAAEAARAAARAAAPPGTSRAPRASPAPNVTRPPPRRVSPAVVLASSSSPPPSSSPPSSASIAMRS
ncbi:helicase [Aureococcus anophagefferens]|nr:helicase [Aureococcus anophagefferens]